MKFCSARCHVENQMGLPSFKQHNDQCCIKKPQTTATDGTVTEEESRAAYVVRADGNRGSQILNYLNIRSWLEAGIVRKQLGLSFVDETRETKRFVIADVHVIPSFQPKVKSSAYPTYLDSGERYSASAHWQGRWSTCALQLPKYILGVIRLTSGLPERNISKPASVTLGDPTHNTWRLMEARAAGHKHLSELPTDCLTRLGPQKWNRDFRVETPTSCKVTFGWLISSALIKIVLLTLPGVSVPWFWTRIVLKGSPITPGTWSTNST